MKNKMLLAIAVVLCFCGSALAAGEVGKTVNLRGTAMIDRSGKSVPVATKTSIELKDVVKTSSDARMKMLFIDDSMLTLGPNSRADIEKFVYSKEGGGASIFKLLEGKMRAVVGKSKFEVHTPTAVAAARGTVIDFSITKHNGVPGTVIHCLNGIVDVRSSNPNIAGVVSLRPGQSVIVLRDSPPPPPTQTGGRGPSDKDKEKDKKDNEGNVGEGESTGNGTGSTGTDGTTGTGSTGTGSTGAGTTGTGSTGTGTTGTGSTGTGSTGTGTLGSTTPVIPVVPPINQTQITTTPVTIKVVFK